MLATKSLRSLLRNRVAYKTALMSSVNYREIMTKLNYQKIVPGKDVGRYINQTDKGDMADEHI